MSGLVTAPTRAAVLQMQDEQKVVREAYTFLDEKRLLLASEILRQLKLYQKYKKELDALHLRARESLRLAVMHHGLDGLQVYPAMTFEGIGFGQRSYNFMGVTLVEIETEKNDQSVSDSNGSDIVSKSAAIVSEKAEACRGIFRDIVKRSSVLAAISGNLYRLLREYRLTERRSRALENVILPEIEQSLRDMLQHLEELDLEDAIRVHLQSGSQQSGL